MIFLEKPAANETEMRVFSPLPSTPVTVPSPQVMTEVRRQELAPLRKPGLYYFHVGAQDGAGNWGPASHVPYYFVE